MMLGGDQGKQKHGPPEGHAPIMEAMMPKEKLRLENCFNFGEVSRGLVYGPAELQDYVAFVPNPVETSHVSIIEICN